MLQVDNLSKGFAGDLLFDEVSFSLLRGDKCAFVGKNGSGKTTLFKILKGEEVPDSGRVHLSKGYKLGFLEQHLECTQSTVLEEALHGPIRKQSYEIESILFGLGFTAKDLDSSPDILSGGYHLRLKLAKLLACDPDCLLLDEPTNYLDILGLRWLKTYLKNWKKECILISHDRSFLDGFATTTMGLHRKKLKKHPGTTEDFYQKIVEEEILYEKTRVNVEKKKKHLTDYIDRFGAKASKAAQAKSKSKALGKLPALVQLSSLEDLSFSFTYSPFHGKKMVSLENIYFSYQEDIPLIEDLSFSVEKGKKVAIIGQNGVGKSTLLRLVEGGLCPQKGLIQKSDQTKIGYFGQTHISRLPADLSIEEVIAQANPRLSYHQVRSICGQMLFAQDAAKKKISCLSGGEKSRVLLGKIIASETNLLLLDEPTHHLDIESIEALLEAIETFEGSVILVTHSEEILERIETDFLIVTEKNKQKIVLGTYSEFLEKGGWKEEEELKPSTIKKEYTKPLSRRGEISALEKRIEKEEKKQEEISSKLAQAVEEGLFDEVTKLSTLDEESQKEIDLLYEKLGSLYERENS